MNRCGQRKRRSPAAAARFGGLQRHMLASPARSGRSERSAPGALGEQACLPGQTCFVDLTHRQALAPRPRGIVDRQAARHGTSPSSPAAPSARSRPSAGPCTSSAYLNMSAPTLSARIGEPPGTVPGGGAGGDLVSVAVLALSGRASLRSASRHRQRQEPRALGGISSPRVRCTA